MKDEEFKKILSKICDKLTNIAKNEGFETPKTFEKRVREEIALEVKRFGINIDLNPPAQGFPDIAVGEYGVEVKYTNNDTWLSIANSVLETNRVQTVENIYVIFGKAGGTPEVRWGAYEDCVVHVRTSHVPRFEVEVPPSEGTIPLFVQMGLKYDDFRRLPMEEKMKHIREYARKRLKKGERLWWLEDREEPEHTLPIQVRLYTKLTKEEQTKLRAEAVLLCPEVVKSSGAKDKYNDVALYLLTYRGVLCHQARDLFSAGSVANPDNDDNGGIYIQRAIKLIEDEIYNSALTLDGELFYEYWGEYVDPEKRIATWLSKADAYAKKWKPSKTLFLEQKYKNK